VAHGPQAKQLAGPHQQDATGNDQRSANLTFPNQKEDQRERHRQERSIPEQPGPGRGF
jgi:hypothetical protein